MCGSCRSRCSRNSCRRRSPRRGFESHARRADARGPSAHRAGRFHGECFADALQFPRFMALAPNGDVFVAEPAQDGARSPCCATRTDGVAETRETFAGGLNRPFGLAFWSNYLYVGNNDSIVRFAYTPGRQATGAAREDRRSAAERCGAGPGHREPPEDRHQPDARLQPLDPQRHLQSGWHEACT